MAFNFTVNVYPFKSPKGKGRAFASVIIEDVMEVKGFKIIEGSRGLFVSVPQKEGTNKEGERTWYPDVIFREDTNPEEGIYQGPIQKEIFDAILAKYQEVSGQQNRGAAGRSHVNRAEPTNMRPANPFGSGPAF